MPILVGKANEFNFIDCLLTFMRLLTDNLKYFHTLYSLLYPYIIQYIIYYIIYHILYIISYIIHCIIYKSLYPCTNKIYNTTTLIFYFVY